MRVGKRIVSPRMPERDTWGVAGVRFHRCWKNSGKVSQGVAGGRDCLGGGVVSGYGWIVEQTPKLVVYSS